MPKRGVMDFGATYDGGDNYLLTPNAVRTFLRSSRYDYSLCSDYPYNIMLNIDYWHCYLYRIA